MISNYFLSAIFKELKYINANFGILLEEELPHAYYYSGQPLLSASSGTLPCKFLMCIYGSQDYHTKNIAENCTSFWPYKEQLLFSLLGSVIQ